MYVNVEFSHPLEVEFISYPRPSIYQIGNVEDHPIKISFKTFSYLERFIVKPSRLGNNGSTEPNDPDGIVL